MSTRKTQSIWELQREILLYSAKWCEKVANLTGLLKEERRHPRPPSGMERYDMVRPSSWPFGGATSISQNRREKQAWGAHVARKPRWGLLEAGDVGEDGQPRNTASRGSFEGSRACGRGQGFWKNPGECSSKAGHPMQVKQVIFASGSCLA